MGQRQLVTSTRQVSEVDEQEPEVEADRLGARKPPNERPEAGKCRRRPILVVATDRRGGEGLRIARRPTRSRSELAFGRDRPQGLLERGAAKEVQLRL